MTKKLFTQTIMWQGTVFYAGELYEIPDNLEKALMVTPPEVIGDPSPSPLSGAEEVAPPPPTKASKTKPTDEL